MNRCSASLVCLGREMTATLTVGCTPRRGILYRSSSLPTAGFNRFSYSGGAVVGMTIAGGGSKNWLHGPLHG